MLRQRYPTSRPKLQPKPNVVTTPCVRNQPVRGVSKIQDYNQKLQAMAKIGNSLDKNLSKKLFY